ncbi:hypothetical protein M422DRAFT_259687 [Sphaerobolus stellatus SS14]|uniref:Uncharacterized protein n=1 Tax=Sphaerobolus stellatus (strain SS14) TaxID=990650 RepID=A0A0C9VK53_SPHS4|nr:hypothetical protein M422DRAFT_259687 [Sphaerobolus stellatus SS14]
MLRSKQRSHRQSRTTLGPLPPPTRPCRQMAGTTDTSGLPGLPPGDNPRENDNSDHRNQSPHPSRNNSPRGSTGGGGNGPPDNGDDGDNGDGDPPPDPPPDGDDPINFADDIHRELRSLLSDGTTLEFFEPYILAEDDPDYVEPTFFTDWIAFKQILLDNFGSTFPKEKLRWP